MIILATILFFGFIQALQDTVGEGPDGIETDSLQAVSNDNEEEEVSVVIPWPERTPPGQIVAEADSTLRWFLTRDWTDRLGRAPGSIFYRTGSIGRSNGIDIFSYENRHQKLELYELSANDPVTGQVNWLRLPMSKISSISTSAWRMSYQANAQLQDHYLTQPRTFLNFYESSENYRTLEFAISQNLVPELNLELSFRDRKDGTLYPLNDFNGTQTAFRGRYHLNDSYVLKTGLYFNSLNQDQPFGYLIEDMSTYNFNPYNAAPVRSSASSSQRMNDMFVQLFRRDRSEEASESMAGISRRTDEWLMTTFDDTVHYTLERTSLNGRHDFRYDSGSIRLEGSADYLHDAEQLSLTRSNWFQASGDVTFEQAVTRWFTLNGAAGYSLRNDDKSGYEISGMITFKPFSSLSLSAHTGVQSMIPDIQALYWLSEDWTGNSELSNETGTLTGVSAEIRAGPIFSAGVQADRREVGNGIFAGSDGSFINIDTYHNHAYSAWIRLDTPVVESEWSVTSQDFKTDSGHQVNRNLANSGEKMWIKGSLFWKNYLFNRATFVKAGLSGRYSPVSYSASEFLEYLNRWQHGVEAQKLPSFYTVDLDVSARVRWMMVLVRWENLLDQVTQQGYFETAGFPMPGRRFIFGVRVLFTN